jgi:hypothetical protein
MVLPTEVYVGPVDHDHSKSTQVTPSLPESAYRPRTHQRNRNNVSCATRLRDTQDQLNRSTQNEARTGARFPTLFDLILVATDTIFLIRVESFLQQTEEVGFRPLLLKYDK